MESEYREVIITRTSYTFKSLEIFKKIIEKIMPKYNEETLFSISLTVIILDLLYYKIFFNPIGFLFFSPILVAYFLSIFFALTNFQIGNLSIQTKYKNYLFTYILGILFLTEFYFGVISSDYWYKIYKESPIFFDKILIIFPIINYWHIIFVFGVIGKKVIKIEKLYVGGNANKLLLLISTAVVSVSAWWFKNYTDYPFQVICSIIIGFCSIVIGLGNLIEIKKKD